MAFPRLDIVDPNNTATVLWSFNDQLGAVNTGGIRTKLGAVQFGVDVDIQTAEFSGSAGGHVLSHRDRLLTSSLLFYPEAPTGGIPEDVWATSHGLLQRLLAAGGIMAWQRTSGSAERFIDFEPSPRSTYLHGQHLPDLGRVDEGLLITFLMQPWLRAASATSSGVTVPNDPATNAKVRIYPVTIPGDLPTAAKIRIQMGASAAVTRALIAWRAQGAQASTVMSDFLSETGFAQMEASGRGWTVSFPSGSDTTGAIDAEGSPGPGTSVARTSYASEPTLMQRRVHATRTTLLDSLRGTWDVWVRAQTSAASVHELQMATAPTTVEPAANRGPLVEIDSSDASTHGYVEKKLGSFTLPATGSLAGLTLDFFSRRVSGTGNLQWDFFWLVPKENQATVILEGHSKAEINGADLTTPPLAVSGDSPVRTAGGVVGKTLQLATNGEAGGWGPNTGTAFAAGRHVTTFTGDSQVLPFGSELELRIVNVTDSVVVPGTTRTFTYARRFSDLTVTWDAVGGKLYQPQVALTDWLAGTVTVAEISDRFTAALGVNESVSTEPGPRYAVDRLDSSGNIIGDLSIEGEVPAILEPGLNHIFVRCDQVPIMGYEEGQNILARTPTVSVTYQARYAL